MGCQILVALGVGLALMVLAAEQPVQHAADLSVLQEPDSGSGLVLRCRSPCSSSSARRNAVNLTDGLDGLAISTFGVAAAAFTALAYVTGHAVLADYLLLVRFPPAGELTIFCGALVGASLGFLWYNSYPAEIFMGDVGSLALGGALGTVAILIKQELLLPIVGGVFVIEALSVVIQVASFKLTGKRVFKMAPHPPSLRADWLERAEGDHPLSDPGGHLCAVQPDDAEAAVMAWVPATSRCGDAGWWWSARPAAASRRRNCWRSGVRVVTLTEARNSVRRRGPAARRRAWSSKLGGHRRGDARGRRSDRREPGRSARAAGVRRARAIAASRSSASWSSRRAGFAAG